MSYLSGPATLTFEQFRDTIVDKRNPATGRYWQTKEVAATFGVPFSVVDQWLSVIQSAHLKDVYAAQNIQWTTPPQWQAPVPIVPPPPPVQPPPPPPATQTSGGGSTSSGATASGGSERRTHPDLPPRIGHPVGPPGVPLSELPGSWGTILPSYSKPQQTSQSDSQDDFLSTYWPLLAIGGLLWWTSGRRRKAA